MTETLDQNGVWYNFTITSSDCYVCVPNGAGYGDLECTPCAVVANFVANVTESIAPATIQFNDTSTGDPTGWNWSFGDGNYSNLQNPTHEYVANGVYNVMLYATSGIGNDTELKVGYIVLADTPPLHIEIKANVGENKIDWAFSPKSPATTLPPLNIYLDDSDIPSEINYTASQYLVPQLDASERHTIAVRNATAQSLGFIETPVKSTAKTLTNSGEVYAILIICIVVLLILIFNQNLLFAILASVFNIILSIVGMMLSQGYGFLPFIFIGLSIITGLFLLIITLPKLRDQISWM